jgi:hypothetical protein
MKPPPSIMLDIVKESLLSDDWDFAKEDPALIQVIRECLRAVVADYERLLAGFILTQDDGK